VALATFATITATGGITSATSASPEKQGFSCLLGLDQYVMTSSNHIMTYSNIIVNERRLTE